MDNKLKYTDKKRILWIDAAKFVGIFMVAFGHNWIDAKFCYYFYSFHMPLFFMLAGVTFSNKRDFSSFFWRKFKTLIIPYVFFAICIIAVYFALSYTHSGTYDVVSEIKAFTLQRRHTHLWFLPVLFAAELVAFGILTINKRNKSIILSAIILILITIHFCMNHFGINNWIWNLDLVPLASAFLIIGYFYKIHDRRFAIENNLWFVGLLMVLSVSISTVNYINYGHIDMYSNKYGNYPLFIPGAIISTYFLILILKRVSLPQWLIYIGTYSLVYYGLHRILIDFMFVVYSKLGIVFDGDSLTGVCLACMNVLVAILLLYPIVEFINKKTPWLIGKF